MKKVLNACFIIALVIGGCAPWIMVGGNFEDSKQNFKAEFPDGWRKFNLSSKEVLITKDGISLQFIRISKKPIDMEFQHTEKRFTKDMLPQEVAETVLQDFRSNPELMNQQILSNNPSIIAGQPGFHIVMTFQTNNGLTKQSVKYGFLSGDYYYELLYEAPQRYYFVLYESDFEKVKETFKLLRDNV